jgi:hypothetical protein
MEASVADESGPAGFHFNVCCVRTLEKVLEIIEARDYTQASVRMAHGLLPAECRALSAGVNPG